MGIAVRIFLDEAQADRLFQQAYTGRGGGSGIHNSLRSCHPKGFESSSLSRGTT